MVERDLKKPVRIVPPAKITEAITPIAFCGLCNDTIQLSEDVRRKILPDKKQYRYHPSVKIAFLITLKPFLVRCGFFYLV